MPLRERLRQRSAYAIRKSSLLCRMDRDRGRGGDRLHGLGGHEMNWLDHNILTLVTFVPAAGALLLVVLPTPGSRHPCVRPRNFAADLCLCRCTYRHTFTVSKPVFSSTGQSQWITTPNIHYHMGMDGISMWLVVLTTFLTPLCVLISWKSIHERVKEFFILLLVLETALIGVFRRPRPVPLLLLLGSHADPDGAADRRVRPRAPSLCRGEVLPVHDDCIGLHAGGDFVAIRKDRQL